MDRSGGPDACHPWTGSTTKGYGTIGRGKGHRGQKLYTHRVAYELMIGEPVPDELCVLHRCDNPPCCNPLHLFLGTLADNNADTKAKGRNNRGEHHGNACFTEQDIRDIRGSYPTENMPALARRYGVRTPTIHKIIHRRSWAHVE